MRAPLFERLQRKWKDFEYTGSEEDRAFKNLVDRHNTLCAVVDVLMDHASEIVRTRVAEEVLFEAQPAPKTKTLLEAAREVVESNDEKVLEDIVTKPFDLERVQVMMAQCEEYAQMKSAHSVMVTPESRRIMEETRADLQEMIENVLGMSAAFERWAKVYKTQYDQLVRRHEQDYVLAEFQLEDLLSRGDIGYPDRGTPEEQREYMRSRLAAFKKGLV